MIRIDCRDLSTEASANSLQGRDARDCFVKHGYVILDHVVPEGKVSILRSELEARLAQPDTVSQEAMMMTGLTLMYVKSEPAAAADQFRRVLERNPVHYGAHFQLARALALAGDYAGAKAEYRELLNVWKQADPDVPAVRQAKSEFAALLRKLA